MQKALIFDVFGTVVDWRTGVAEYVRPIFAHKGIALDPENFADQWRAEYDPAMARIRDGNRGYVALDILHMENLGRVLARNDLGEVFSTAERHMLNKAWEHLPPWPDSVKGLQSLKQNHIIAPCSNGSIALMTRLAKFGGLPWDCILGAEIARNYKPDHRVYLSNCSALGLQPQDVMMVACHNSDLKAARDAGLQTAFFPRSTEHGPAQTIDLSASHKWDIVTTDIVQLFETLSEKQ